MPHHVNYLTGQIIGSAIEVHRALGPGLLESAYREALARELLLRSIAIKSKWPIPLVYKVSV
jgi:GxxExxY protein